MLVDSKRPVLHLECKEVVVETNKPLTNVEVKLIGTDGNAFAVLGKVNSALKRAGHTELAEQFLTEATKGDYDHLLSTCMKYVEVT